MAQRGTLKLRLLSGAAVLLASTFAALGVLLWSDPLPVIEQLAGEPQSIVRNQEFETGSQRQEAFRITTTGGLELELLVLRPNSEGRVPLIIVGLDSKELLEVAQGWAGTHSCAVAFFSCQFQTTELFELRRSSERAAASFLVARRTLLEKPWLALDEIHLIGQGRTASAACLVAESLPGRRPAWRLEIFPPAPSGLRDRLAYELAFGGSRAPTDSGAKRLGDALLEGLDSLEEQIAANRDR